MWRWLKRRLRPKEEESAATHVVVGNGEAALSAVQQLRTTAPHDDVSVLSSAAAAEISEHGERLVAALWAAQKQQQSRPLSLAERWEKLVSDAGGAVRIVPKAAASAVHPLGRRVLLADGRSVRFRRCCLVACDSKQHPKWLADVASSSSAATFFSTHRDIARVIAAADAADSATTFAVVGGGIVGTQLAAFLADRTHGVSRVVLVDRDPAPLAPLLPPYLSSAVGRVLAEDGIDVVSGAVVSSASTAALADGRNVVTLSLRSSTVQQQSAKAPPRLSWSRLLREVFSFRLPRIRADHVFVVPDSDRAEPCDAISSFGGFERDTKRGGICVNAELQARTGVYAAGEVASFFDPVLQRRWRSSLLDHAVETGKLAGFNMAGARKPYLALPSFRARIRGGGAAIDLEGVGMVRSGPKVETFGVWEKPQAAASPFQRQLNRGVVYYLDGSASEHAKVHGVLLWNVPGRADNARRVLWDGKSWPDRTQLVQQVSLEPLGDELLEAAQK